MVSNLFSQNSNIFGLCVVRKGSWKNLEVGIFPFKLETCAFRHQLIFPTSARSLQVHSFQSNNSHIWIFPTFPFFQLPLATTCKPNRALESVSGLAVRGSLFPTLTLISGTFSKQDNNRSRWHDQWFLYWWWKQPLVFKMVSQEYDSYCMSHHGD